MAADEPGKKNLSDDQIEEDTVLLFLIRIIQAFDVLQSFTKRRFIIRYRPNNKQDESKNQIIIK